MQRISMTLIALLMLTFFSSAQDAAPVKWQVTVKLTSPTEGVAIFKARLEPGWHLYGLEMPQGGPKATVINTDESTGVEFTGALTPDRAPLKVHDSMFNLDLSWWDKDIAFRRKFKVTNPSNACIAGTITFMGCNDMTCSPPSAQKFSKKVVSTPAK